MAVFFFYSLVDIGFYVVLCLSALSWIYARASRCFLGASWSYSGSRWSELFHLVYILLSASSGSAPLALL